MAGVGLSDDETQSPDRGATGPLPRGAFSAIFRASHFFGRARDPLDRSRPPEVRVGNARLRLHTSIQDLPFQNV